MANSVQEIKNKMAKQNASAQSITDRPKYERIEKIKSRIDTAAYHQKKQQQIANIFGKSANQKKSSRALEDYGTVKQYLDTHGSSMEQDDYDAMQLALKMMDQQRIEREKGIAASVKTFNNKLTMLTNGPMGYRQLAEIDDVISSYDGIKEYIAGSKTLRHAMEQLKKYREYLSGFENEDHYRVLNMSADELKAELDKGESPVAYTTKDGYNFTWQNLYDDAMQRKDLDDKVTKLSANADWDSLGSYTSEDMLADYQSLYGIGSQNVPMSREEAQRLGYDRRQYEALQDERRKISEKYGVDISDHDAMTRLTNTMREIAEYTDEMTADEKAVLSSLFRTEGAQAALDWFDSRRYLYEGRKAGTIRKENAEYSKAHPIKGSLKALGNTMLSPLEYLVDTMRFAGTDEKYYNMQAVGSAGYKQGVTDKYDWKVGNADAFDFLYNTGMSMVESRVAGTIGGPFASMALGLSAGSQAANDAFERGMDKKHAVATGIAAAIAEMLFESFSIGNFEALKEIPSANLKDIGRNIGKSLLVNASEETATEVANIAYDMLINGDFSQWDTEYRQNIANDMTPEQAKAKAWGSTGKQVVEAGASGALMGVGFGALGSTRALGYNAANAYNNYRNQSAIAKDILQTDGGVAQLQEAAQQAEAPQLQEKLDKQSAKVTEKATKGNVRRLYNTLGKAYSQQDVSQISQTLESKGVDSQISQELAQAIVDNSQQKILTDKQSNLLFEHIGSKAVQDTLQETTGNAESEVSQRRATLKGMEGVNAVTRELTRMGVKKDYAQTIANVVVAQRQQQKLSTQEQGILEAVQKNEKLATAIRYAEDDVDKSVQEVFAGFGERYGGSNQVIANMPQVQKDVFAQVYDPKVNTNSAEFAHAMAAAYALGYKNQNMGDISQLADGALIATLTDTQRQFAWKEGREVAQADADVAQQNVDTAYEQSQEMLQQSGQTAKENHTITTKGIDVESMDEAQRASYDLAERIAPGIKAEIVVYNGGKEWGRYDHKTDTIHLNANAKWQEKTMMAFTLAHELVHRAKLGSPKQFGAFADFLMEQYGKQGSDVDAMIAEQMDAADRFDATAAEKDKIHMTEDAAFEEVICDACQRMLLDTNAGRKLAQWGAQSQQNKDFLTKVKEIIESILRKLRSAYKGVKADSLAGQEFAKFDRNTRKILADMFVDMSIDAGEKLSTIKEAGLLDQLNKNTAQEGGRKHKNAVSYDYTKPFAEQIDDFKAGLIPKGDTLLLGGTPQLYRQLGFNALPMTINATHVDYALNGTKDADHYMGEAMLKQLPERIKEPVAVFVSQTHGTTSVIALLNFTVNGKQTVAPIIIDGFGFQNNIRINSNAITSTYGKTTAIKQLYQAVKDDAAGKFALLYANKKEATTLLQRAGHQLSGRLMPRDGFYHSIRENNSPVKPKFNNVTETQQFRKWFGDWMKHPNKASKVVNSDGVPMVVYHGSADTFDAFSYGHIGSASGVSVLGDGFYFTDKKNLAKNYGDQVYACYLQMKKPYYATEADAYKLNAKKLEAQGYDGVILKSPKGTVYMVFKNTQIKSATDNVGTFDGSTPDIRYKVPVEDADGDQLSSAEYNRLTAKKPIKVSSQEWAMIGKQRKSKYAGFEESDIPLIDFFRIGDYRLVNNGYIYYVRNISQDVFSVVMRKQIVPNATWIAREVSINENSSKNERTGAGVVQEGRRSGSDRSGDFSTRNGRELRENDPGNEQTEESQQGVHDRQGNLNSGTGLSRKLPVGKDVAKQQAAKDSLVHYREALRDQKNDTRVMEKEFARLARVFETQARRSGKKDVDIADLKTALKAEAKKHRADQKVWEAEFNRLLRAYETAGRQIDRLEQIIARQRQAAHDKVESRRKTEMRHKIIRFKEKLQSTLQRPTDNSFVPVDLIGAMVDVCELIDTDSPLYKADGSINKAQQVREQTKERLQALKDEYEKLKAKSDPIYAGEFDETVYAYIDELRQNFAGKSLTDMSLAELGEMYEILRSIDETLQDARQLIDFGEKVDVYEAGDAIITEQKGITRKRKNGHRTAAERARDANFNYTLSPVRNVERMSAYHGDSFLLKLFKKFEQGIRKKNKFTMDAYKLFEKLTAGKEYEQAMYSEVGGKKYEDVNGRRFGISKMQMMQAVLSFEREAANGHNHIQKGGFTFADIDMLKKGKLKEAISEEFAHRVPAAVELVESFTEILKNDKWCQQYMEAARSFFNGMAKDAINETSVAWKHRIVAKEKSYIPYEVDKNFVVSEISAANNIQETINAYGMLKATQDHAPQPLIITGLNNILDRHIEKVGAVYGLAIPVRNFNKVWNMRSNSISGNPTVKSMIQLNWGNEGVKHIEQAVQDIQGARSKNQSALYQRVKSGYIGATFLLNLSVVTKQIGSLFAATSMLKWRGPVRMIWNLGSTMINHKKIAAEVDRFTASAWLRRQGVSDAELHTLMTQAQKPGFFKWLSKAPAWLNPTKWISAMDHAVALSLWKYAKADTAKRTGLRGEELLQATAEFYDEVIESTQSMTDVLHRPEVQKRGDVASDAFGMFKTDLYQMAGQLQMAAGRFAANKNGENGRTMGRTVYAIAMSAIWGQLMTTLFALLRYKVNPYRDEEDKDLTVESWLKRQGYALAGDLLGYIFPLLGGEAVGFFENIAYGESEDFADSIALTAVNDLYDIMVTVGSSIKDGEMPKQSDLRKIATKALQIMGVPANNILRTLDAVRLHAQDIANGEFFAFEAGVQRTAANHIHRIVEAAAGNADIAQGLYEEAVEDIAVRKSESGEAGEEERKEARSELQSALGTKYKDGEVSAEVVEQILADFLGKTEDDIYWLMDKWNYAKENGSTEDYAKYEKFFTAVQTGEQLRKVVKEYTDNGVEEKTLKSQITSHFKPMWVHMSTSERGKIRGYLVNAFVMLGDTREEAIKKINNWK